MSLSDRRTLLLGLAALPLAACGFTPVYQKGGAAQGLQGQIFVALVDSHEGFGLLERLESRLGTAGSNARFAMALELEITEEKLIINALSGINRYTLKGKAGVKVTDQTTGTVVFSDTIREVVGFSGTTETAQSAAAKKDAYDRLVLALADQIVMRVNATAASWAA